MCLSSSSGLLRGNNTREWHAVMEGVVVEENELFVVNGEYMEYPTDDSNGATAPNIINCSCGVMRMPKRVDISTLNRERKLFLA